MSLSKAYPSSKIPKPPYQEETKEVMLKSPMSCSRALPLCDLNQDQCTYKPTVKHFNTIAAYNDYFFFFFFQIYFFFFFFNSHDSIHVRMSFSQIIPPSPSPSESKVRYTLLCLFPCLAYRVVIAIFLNSIYMC